MKTRYIHIGFPKNFSTSLQRGYFDVHPQLLHLGIGCGSNVDYIDKRTSIYMENFLVYANPFAYRREKDRIIHHFNRWFEKVEEFKSKKALGVSLEHLSFCFTGDNIDTVTKAERLHEIFGSESKIIMIIRNQWDLLRSLYRESIRMGYDGSYKDFLHYVWVMKDRNFFYDFSYDLVFRLYSDLFGLKNILVLTHEKMRDTFGRLINQHQGIHIMDQLSDFLGCDRLQSELGHFNESLDGRHLAAMRVLNRKYRHDLGNGQYGRSANFHRLKHYLIEELGQPDDDAYIYQDVIVKRRNIERAAETKNQYASIDYEADVKTIDNIFGYYDLANRDFEKISGIKLPEAYLTLRN